jgi:WhiB family redox-sensing transcriptional regulator
VTTEASLTALDTLDPLDPGAEGGDPWQDHAACRDLDQRLFFEPSHESSSQRTRRVRAAKAVCAECPVRRQCLRFALEGPERYGIWGGLTASERELIQQRRVSAA